MGLAERTASELTRFQVPGVGLSAPAALRAGNFVFTSTIYPVGDDGQALVADARRPFAPDSTTTLQSRLVFDHLETVLEAAGASLNRVIRCEVMLATVADFYDFNLVWKERFPDDPPARLTIGVGDTHPVPDARVALHAVALASDSAVSREIVQTSDAVDTLAGEHSAQAVRAGDYVFTTTLPALTDYEQGVVPERNPLASVPEMQTTQVMENLNAVLQAAGTSLQQAVKSQNLMVDLEDWKDINRVWREFMQPVPPPRTSVSVESLIAPGARVMANVVALVPSPENQKEDVRAGLRFHVGEHGYAFSPAVRTRDWISLAGHLSYDYASFALIGSNLRMPHLSSEIEAQVDGIMKDRLEILEANGAGIDDIVEAKVYLCHPRRDVRGFLRAWRRWFPNENQSPALQLIPVTGVHYQGTIIEIELLAARR